MNKNAFNASPSDARKRLPDEPNRFTFKRLLLALAGIALIAAFVFWLTCIRQPGVSYSKADLDASRPPIQDSKKTSSSSQSAAGSDVAARQVLEAKTDVESSLKNYVEHLAITIGERNLRRIQNLNEAAEFVEAEFTSFGLHPNRQTYEVQGLDCHNIDAEIKGSKLPQEIVIVGAHYDSFEGTPGANDNGSGTAAMLVLAKHFAASKPDRTLRFAAWTNEEPPYFQHRGLMGSWVYAERCRHRMEDIKAVLSLETMGCFSNEVNSQKYPPPLNLIYPSTGNFIGFVANMNSRGLQRRVIKTFREYASVPSEGAALPESTPGVGWSDHWSFWQEGYTGIMVTDTAPFRYPHYHRPSDTPDKINFPEMAKVVEGLKFVVEDLVKAEALEPEQNRTHER